MNKMLNEIREYSGVKQINEGLVFFKDSKRIRKYIDKISKKNDGSLDDLLEKLKDTSDNFEEAEKLYSSGKKEKAKQLHEQLKRQNQNLIKILNKESVKSSLIKAGVVALVFDLILKMTIGRGIFSLLFSGNSQGAVVATATTVDPNSLESLRSELTNSTRDLQQQLRQNQAQLNNITNYEKALGNIEAQQRNAQRLAERAARELERAQARAAAAASRL